MSQNQKLNITLDSEPITEVFSNYESTAEWSSKILDFEIDERLDFKSHISNFSKKRFNLIMH